MPQGKIVQRLQTIFKKLTLTKIVCMRFSVSVIMLPCRSVSAMETGIKKKKKKVRCRSGLWPRPGSFNPDARVAEIREKLGYLTRITVIIDVTIFTIWSQHNSKFGHSVTHKLVTVSHHRGRTYQPHCDITE